MQAKLDLRKGVKEGTGKIVESIKQSLMKEVLF